MPRLNPARRATRAERRGRAVFLLSGLGVAFWALADLVARRHGALLAEGHGFFRHVGDHVQPVAWTLGLVAVPLALALKPAPRRAAAILAVATGPVAMPLVFGPGGWHLWQIGAFGLIVLQIESADQRAGRRAAGSMDASGEPAYEDDEEEDVPRPVARRASSPVPSSLHEISGASLHRRSSP